MNALINYLVLPRTITDFESRYLTRMNRIAALFFMAHVPAMVLLAFFNGTGPGLALVLTTATLMGPLLAWKSLTSLRNVSIVMGIASMLMGGLLVHFGQGPVQIEMHFYFFVLLALLAVFANPMVICAAAVTVALHHAILWYFLPSSVFNYDAPFWVVGVHAAFVVLESVAACFIARSFFDNVIGLEKIVAARTEELEGRNQDMRMLLDSVGQGFFTVDSSGTMSEERSAAVQTLLGATADDTSVFEVLRRHDSKAADWMEISLDEVFADIMPIELTLDQLPKRCIANERTLSFEYNLVYAGQELRALAVVVSDITAEVEQEKLQSQNREILAMVERITHDKAGFLEFFQEAESLVHALQDRTLADLAVVKRRVHTLKGNASIFGLQRVAQACHEIEDHIAEQQELPDETAWATMFECWESVRGNLDRLITDTAAGITLDDAEYEAVLQSILNDEPRELVATRVAAWRLEPTSQRLNRLMEQAKALGRRLGKGEVNVTTRCGNLRTEAQRWSDFWQSFVHVIRNAIDHGLEHPEDRLAAGKPESGHVEISTTIEKGRYVITIADDGKGIDWDRVATAAARKGLPNETASDLEQALFADGLSTAEYLSETSGRGVGMAAVKESCEALGGQITIETVQGRGTTVRFDFAMDSMAPETTEMLLLNEINDMRRLLVRDAVQNSPALSV